MLRNLIVIAEGNARRQPVLPRRPPSEVRRCRNLDEVVASVTEQAATCVVLAGTLADAVPVARVRAAASAPIVVVAAGPVAHADIVVSPGDCARGYLAGIVRHLLGEPGRRSGRVAAAGVVRVVDTGEELAMVDLAEGGVRVVRDDSDADDEGDRAIVVATGGLEFSARARVIRRHGPTQAVFGFIGLHGADPMRLRAWMARAGGTRVCA